MHHVRAHTFAPLTPESKELRELNQKASPSGAPAGRGKFAKAKPNAAPGPPGTVVDLNQDRLWRDGPTAVSRLTGLADSQARKLLGRMIAASRSDFIGLLRLLHDAEAKAPLADAQAYLMAGARGGGPTSRDRRKSKFGAAWAKNLVSSDLGGLGLAGMPPAAGPIIDGTAEPVE